MNNSLLITLAEDNAADVFLVRSALEQEGFKFHLRVLSDGGQALRFLEEVENDVLPCPDILLLDLNLPIRSGTEILAKLRESTKCSSACVVVLSSSEAPQDKERVARLGVTHYFVKSGDLDEFMKLGLVVREAWEKNGTNGNS
jgi:CheY-like chemotaxis protein